MTVDDGATSSSSTTTVNGYRCPYDDDPREPDDADKNFPDVDYLDHFNRNDYFGYFDYDDYFDYDPKTMAPESEDPRIRCVTPTLTLYAIYISVSYKIMHN